MERLELLARKFLKDGSCGVWLVPKLAPDCSWPSTDVSEVNGSGSGFKGQDEVEP